MTKKTLIALLTAASMAALPVYAVFAEETAPAEETVPAEEAAPAETVDISAYQWSDYAISIDGQVYQFPMAYADCDLTSWECDEDPYTYTLDPNQYTWLYYSQGERTLMVFVTNLSINTLPVSECLVYGVQFDDYYWEPTDGDVRLPGGIVRGSSTLDDITAAYGPAADTYEGSDYTQVTYETAVYESLELTVSSESGVLTEIDMRNLREPEGFYPGDVSYEVPAEVAAYTKPEALSEDFHEWQIEVEGNVYTLPVPVSTLVADGWELRTDDSDAAIPAHSSGWVTLQYGGISDHILVRNYSDLAVTPDNAWVTEIALGQQDMNLNGRLCGGITTGMSREEVESALTSAGITYETEDTEGSNFVYFSYDNEEYGLRKTISLYRGDESIYPTNAVLTIAMRKDTLE